MDDKFHKIFSESDCPPEEKLISYLKNELSGKEKNDLEKHLVDCEMCSDFVEGMSPFYASGQTPEKIIEEIKVKIDSRVEEKKIIRISDYRIRIAAAVLLLIGISSVIILNVVFKKDNDKLFSENFEPYTDTIQAAGQMAEGSVPTVDSTKIMTIAQNSRIEDLKRTELEIEKVLNYETDKKSNKDQDVNLIGFSAADPGTAIATSTTSASGASAVTEEIADEAYYFTPDIEQEKDVVVLDAEEQVDIAQNRVSDNVATSTDQEPSTDKMTGGLLETTTVELAKTKDSEKASSGKKDRAKGNSNVAPSTKAEKRQEDPSLEEKETVVNSDVVNQLIVDGKEKYENERYKKAADDFSGALQLDGENTEALFYAAVSYLSAGNTPKSLMLLEELLRMDENQYTKPAQWYYALALIKEDKKDNAREILEKITSDTTHPYYQKAKDLLIELK